MRRVDPVRTSFLHDSAIRFPEWPILTGNAITNGVPQQIASLMVIVASIATELGALVAQEPAAETNDSELWVCPEIVSRLHLMAEPSQVTRRVSLEVAFYAEALVFGNPLR